MEYIIDTSTWVSLIRYYKLFDTSSIIYDFFKRKIENKVFVLINEVSIECSYVSNGFVAKELDFVKDKKFITKTVDILPSKKFYNLLENQFCNAFQRRNLQDFEIENLTESFIKSADAKIIMTAIAEKKQGQEIIVVTEETITNNDNKLFKKITAMCSALDIKCVRLPELIKMFDNEILIGITNTCA
ncbi:MAG: DUF4411 family protein [Candidatus Atribacteria bacterium]|nr:DUF4411 family protein [Candidatus Atribacteria bacterium]